MFEIVDHEGIGTRRYLIANTNSFESNGAAIFAPGYLLFHYQKELIGLIHAPDPNEMEGFLPEEIIMDEDWLFVSQLCESIYINGKIYVNPETILRLLVEAGIDEVLDGRLEVKEDLDFLLICSAGSEA